MSFFIKSGKFLSDSGKFRGCCCGCRSSITVDASCSGNRVDPLDCHRVTSASFSGTFVLPDNGSECGWGDLIQRSTSGVDCLVDGVSSGSLNLYTLNAGNGGPGDTTVVIQLQLFGCSGAQLTGLVTIPFTDLATGSVTVSGTGPTGCPNPGDPGQNWSFTMNFKLHLT